MIALVVLALLALVVPAASITGAAAATVQTEPGAGPALDTPVASLDDAVSCTFADPSGAHEPVLLVHGTGATPAENFGWNYGRVLPDRGFDTCTVTMPDRALGDMQVSAEYVVHAIRRVGEWTGRPVDVVGHSQGGIVPRWAVKFWPDVSERVDDFVMLGAPNHGTVVADLLSAVGCVEACYQFRTDSQFNAALNAGDETPGDVSYTSIYSAFDQLVQPNRTSPPLQGARNLLVQSVCPLRPVEHVGLVADGVVFDAVLDALTQAGGADPARFRTWTTCLQGTFPGVDPLGLLSIGAQEFINGDLTFPDPHIVTQEPPLRSYASA